MWYWLVGALIWFGLFASYIYGWMINLGLV